MGCVPFTGISIIGSGVCVHFTGMIIIGRTLSVDFSLAHHWQLHVCVFHWHIIIGSCVCLVLA